VAAKARIPVEFYFDEELGTWHFHVDEPRIVGGGQKTIEKAREAAAKAIAFALDGAERPMHGGKIEYLDVAVGS
jgi:hypothetical protein